MNPTIIVQQNIAIPAGPLPEIDSKSNKQPKGKSVAAIIRPMPQESGQELSLRIDSAEPTALQPHVRTHQLDDYVNWLREKFEQDKADTRPVAQEEETTASEAAPVSIPVEVEPVVAETVEPQAVSTEELEPSSMFSTITTETDLTNEVFPNAVQDLENPIDSQPPASPARGFSTANFDRIDQPHDSLCSSYVKFDELTSGDDVTTGVSVESSLLDLSTERAEQPTSTKLSAEDTEQFIATISKAIASVLTETPEPEFEERVRSHFESELQARSARVMQPSEISAVDTDKLDRAPVEQLAESGGNSIEAMKSEADKIAHEVLAEASSEIPTNIAAWDVEDFRWPVVTNQMIVSGGEALDQLCQSTLNMIAPSDQRVAIAGLGRGEGTTSIAISLARWAAACGKRVLLVDADLVTPGLSKQVGLGPNLSWINVVSQSLAPAETIVRSQKSNLCIMPLAQMVSRVTWPRFIYDNLGEVLDQVRNHFDLVLLDVGPANQLMAELSRPALLVDATLLVHNGVNSPEFQKTKSRLEMFGLSKFIVAQNRAQQQSANVA